MEIYCVDIVEVVPGLLEWRLVNRAGEVSSGLWSGSRGLLETLVALRVEALRFSAEERRAA